jgi:hypothetical protein
MKQLSLFDVPEEIPRFFKTTDPAEEKWDRWWLAFRRRGKSASDGLADQAAALCGTQITIALSWRRPLREVVAPAHSSKPSRVSVEGLGQDEALRRLQP